MFREKGLAEQAAEKTNKTKSQNEAKLREWLEGIKMSQGRVKGFWAGRAGPGVRASAVGCS